jgi:hypothetical protein
MLAILVQLVLLNRRQKQRPDLAATWKTKLPLWVAAVVCMLWSADNILKLLF